MYIILFLFSLVKLSVDQYQFDIPLYMCMMIYHKTSNQAMKVFQQNIDLSQYQKDEVDLIKEKSQQFILTNVLECQNKLESQNEKDRFQILRDIVAQKNMEKYTEKFMNFKLDYQKLLAEDFSQELKLLQKKLKEIKSMNKKQITQIFNLYFMDNLKFLSWEDRIAFYMNKKAFLIVVIIILSFGSLYFLFKLIHDRKQFQLRQDDVNRIKKFVQKEETFTNKTEEEIVDKKNK